MWLTCFICLLLGLVTILVYAPVRTHDFLRIDDPDYVLQNPHVNSGLNLQNVVWAFTHSHSSNWHPLTWISHMLDCQMFGLNASAHHLVNVGWHVLNSVMLLLLLQRLTGVFWRSAFVAGCFALHPLHVESVAWVAERKDVLSAFFGFLSLWAYARYVECRVQTVEPKVRKPWSVDRRSAFWYGGTLVLFALGLMSKPMLVTWPCVLLLLDYWPLRRLKLATFRHLFIEKLPFFALAAASSLVTFLVQRNSGAVVTLDNLPLELRLGNAVVSYARYLQMMFVPSGLSIFYPLPREVSDWQLAAAIVFLVTVTGIALKLATRKPYVLTGWLWYLGTLVPVIGVVQAGVQAMADRYTYIPLVGIFALIAWALGDLAERYTYVRRPLTAGGLAAIIGCALLTSHQLRYWKDSRTLYQHAAEVTPNNFMAMTVLGALFWEEGKLPEAKTCILEGLKQAPRSPDLNSEMGFVLIGDKQFSEAQAHFEQALSTDSTIQRAHYGLAYCLYQQNRFAEAERSCRRAWELNPQDLKAGLLTAMTLQSQNRPQDAEASYRQTLQIKPGWVPAVCGLAGTLDSCGRSAEAEALYRQAITSEPKDLEAHNGLALTLANQGKLEAAMAQYLHSLELTPDQPLVHCSLAGLLSQIGRTPEAIQHYREALRLQPDFGMALNNLAWLLATHPQAQCRNGREAVQLAERACKQAQDTVPVFLGTLAAAYAEAGRFDDAIQTAEKARSLAQAAGLKAVAERNQELLELYRTGRPYHEPNTGTL